MATQVQFRRGNTTQHSTFTGANGEITFDTDKKTIVVHDGSTAGGFTLLREGGSPSLNSPTVTGTLTVSGTVSSNLIPTTNVTYSLGNTTHRWSNLYLSGTTIVIGDQTISSNSSGVNLSGAFYVNGAQIANSTVVSLGANVVLDTSKLSIGNSSVNTFINSTSISTSEISVGNLTVTGTQTILNTQTLTVNDNIVVLNNGWAGAPTEDAGIEIARGSANNVSLLWDEDNDKWTITEPSGTSYNIATNNDVATAYSNATTYSSNADNITSGTLNTARLPGTANVSTAVNVGGNVSINTSSYFVGNSSVNTVINSTSISTENVLATNTVNAAILSVGSNIVGNSSGLYTTGTVNSSVISVGSSFLANVTNTNITVPLSVTNTAGLGNTTVTGTLAANDTTITGFANISSTLAAGNTTITGTLGTGNTTVTGFANISSTLAAGNTTITGFANISSTLAAGNTVVSGTLAANDTTITGFANISSTLAAGNTTITGFANVSETISVGSNVIANSTSIKVGNGTTNTIITKNSLDIGNTTVNAIVNSTAITIANSSANATLNPSTLTISTVTATTLSGNGSGITSVDAATVGGNTATDLRNYSSNADNITSGTLNTARLPGTANVSTAINIGANVNLTTSSITVGNSTVNSYITGTSIDVDGTLNVGNTVTFANGLAMSNTVISNVADPQNPYDAANRRYVDAVAEGLHVHASCDAATPNTLAVISGGTVTYNNGSSGDGATLTLDTPITAIDNVSLVAATSRVLVKNEANTAHNGIYLYSNSTVLTRASDYNSAVEMAGGDFTFVTGGDIYNNTGWVQVEGVTTIGTDAVIFIQFSGAGTFTAGDYLYLDGSEFNANANSASVASVLVARDSNQNFSANVITLNTLSSTNATFSGPVSGVTTLGAGNTTITGFANISSTLDAGNTTITGFANVSGTVYVGNSTSNAVISGGSVTVSGYQQSFVTHTSSNTDQQTCDSFAAGTYRSAQYFIQMTSGTDYHTINVSLVHNGTTVYLSQYGEIIENASLGTFDADISGGNVILQVTPTNAVTTLKAVRTLIVT